MFAASQRASVRHLYNGNQKKKGHPCLAMKLPYQCMHLTWCFTGLPQSRLLRSLSSQPHCSDANTKAAFRSLVNDGVPICGIGLRHERREAAVDCCGLTVRPNAAPTTSKAVFAIRSSLPTSLRRITVQRITSPSPWCL
jgi:hypothetical protein